jgi:hypothetical protein
MEIIHLVEHSDLSITKTCAVLDVARSTFSRKDIGTMYRWYRSYQEEGFEGLMDRQPRPRQFCLSWRTRPGEPDPSPGQRADCGAGSGPSREIPRQIAWLFTDHQGYFRLGFERISHPEGLRPDPEPGLPEGPGPGEVRVL